jgi:hypothetical protein
MFISGFLWLVLFTIYSKQDCVFFSHNVKDISLEVFLMFIASYTIGLLYYKSIDGVLWILKRIFGWRKNKERLPIFWFWGCLIHFRNNEKAIRASFSKFQADYKEDKLKSKTPGSRHEYYTAYYALMKANMLNNIPVLEAQVTFLRNITPITLAYIITIGYIEYSWLLSTARPDYFVIALLVALLALLFGMVIAFITTQNKIYYLVWEGYEYLKKSVSDTQTEER